MPVRKPSKELETEIMEFIFSNKCKDHHEALRLWHNNPWSVVSMYELEHYPGNLQWPVAFPEDVDIPEYFMDMLENEDMYAMKGNPIIINYPRAEAQILEVEGGVGYIDKWGRVKIEHDDEEGTD